MNDVCVLIPHYNNYKGLLKSLSSINETKGVSVLVVDDGSLIRPNFVEMCDAVQTNVDLHCIYLIENEGIVSALNYGLDWIVQRGFEYMARLDAGDINYPNRLMKQVGFLNDSSEYNVVGGWVNFIEEKTGRSLFILKHPQSDEEIQSAKYRFNPFVHPAVTMRLESVVKQNGYPDNYPALEDYALFFKLLKSGKGHNIPEVLIDYEIAAASISTTKRFDQSKSKLRLLVSEYQFSFNATVGLLKTVIILLLPRGLLTFLKSKIYK